MWQGEKDEAQKTQRRVLLLVPCLQRLCVLSQIMLESRLKMSYNLTNQGTSGREWPTHWLIHAQSRDRSDPAMLATTNGTAIVLQSFLRARRNGPGRSPGGQEIREGLASFEQATGLRREFLASKNRNLAALKEMGREGLDAARRFALNYCIGTKFRRVKLIPAVERLELEAVAEALSLVRGKPVYLFWRNPNVA